MGLNNFCVGILYSFARVKNFVDKCLCSRERIVSRGDKLRDFLMLESVAFDCARGDFSVSVCGNLDTGGCLPYPHPLIIRVLSNTEKTVVKLPT